MLFTVLSALITGVYGSPVPASVCQRVPKEVYRRTYYDWGMHFRTEIKKSIYSGGVENNYRL